MVDVWTVFPGDDSVIDADEDAFTPEFPGESVPLPGVGLLDLSNFTIDNRILLVSSVGEVKPSLVIGGSDTAKFVPNMNASYQFESGSEKYWWNLNASSVTVIDELPTIDVGKKQIAIRVGNIEERYRLEGAGDNEVIKWLRVFYTHPGTNVFEHTLSFATGVNFYYQPALTQAQIDLGCIRPEEVVGSYAIYCNSSGHFLNDIGGTIVNYRAGKMGHIYPPWFKDADGVEQRGVLYIDQQTGLYRVTIDSAWFAAARFPVIMNDTFGWTGAGASTDCNGGGYTIYGELDALAPAGTLTNLSWYLDNSAAAFVYRYAFYSDTAGAPNSRVARDASTWTTGAGNDQWVMNPVAWSYALTPNAQYWGGIGMIGGGSGTGCIHFDATGSQGLSYGTGDTPDPASIDGDIDTACHVSVYATYTPAGGGTAYTVACADGIVFDDTGRKIATFNVSAADGLALGDTDTGPASLVAAGMDSIALNDLVSMLRFFSKEAADGVAFAEAAERATTFSRLASDGVAFAENAGTLANYLAAAADGIALGDESFYAVIGAIEAFAADGIVLNDVSLASATFQVTAVESIILDDSASRIFTVILVAEDGIALADAISVQVNLDAKAADNIVFNDATQSLAAYLAAATDGIALQDISISITGNLATGILSVTFTTKKSVITLSGKKSLVAMLGKKSNVSMS